MKSVIRGSLLCFAFAVALTQSLSGQWYYSESGTKERLRAVSVVNDSIVWSGGNHGTVLRTIDSGRHWITLKVNGADSLDFRDIEALDARIAFILSIGPGESSRIYKTSDGGSDWVLQYVASDPRIFLDEFAFWDSKNGIAIGDPIDGHMFILQTTNGGNEWDRIPFSRIPNALPGEGAFAASGSGITVEGEANVWFGTGVRVARVFFSKDKGKTWNVASTPIMHRNESSGIFSIAFCDDKNGIVVGGDYKKEQETIDNVAMTHDGGVTWTLAPNSSPAGFRSAVIYLTNMYLVTVGPSGTDYSTDAGKTWKQIDTIGYHALSRARNGKAIWAVGEKGRIGHFVDLIVR